MNNKQTKQWINKLAVCLLAMLLLTGIALAAPETAGAPWPRP